MTPDAPLSEESAKAIVKSCLRHISGTGFIDWEETERKLVIAFLVQDTSHRALASERDELKCRMQVMADMVGEENWSLRNQLADARAGASRLEKEKWRLLRAIDEVLSPSDGDLACQYVAELKQQHDTLTARCETMEKVLQEALKIMPLMIERSWAEASIDTGQATWADVRHLREQATGIESQIKHALSTGGEIGGNNGNAK